jgi:hypothetical protein
MEYWIEVFKTIGEDAHTETMKSFGIEEYDEAVKYATTNGLSLDFWKDTASPVIVSNEEGHRAIELITK